MIVTIGHEPRSFTEKVLNAVQGQMPVQIHRTQPQVIFWEGNDRWTSEISLSIVNNDR